MDQIKIGKFIAECRKKKGFTQMQLAEKLNLTDRAISKWETGRSLPDSSIMHELCEEGSSIFFSTHVLEVAQKLCNKVAIIKEGRIIASGTVEEITQNQSLEEVFLEITNDESAV